MMHWRALARHPRHSSSKGAWHMEGFHEGQKVWVAQSDGSPRAGIFVSDAETPGWFGGPPAAYVVYPDTRSGEEVSLLQITPREEGEAT
jgi:hypothetical protein